MDLIIADIKMPAMTGIELLEKIRAEHISDAYFIILSGYSDFEYARKAIQNSCMDYILKPVRQAELLSVLNKVKADSTQSLQRREEVALQEKAYFARNLIALICGKFDQLNLEHVKSKMRTEGGIRYIDIEIDDRPEDESGKLLLKSEEEKDSSSAFYTNTAWISSSRTAGTVSSMCPAMKRITISALFTVIIWHRRRGWTSRDIWIIFCKASSRG